MTGSQSKYPDTAEQSLWIARARRGDHLAFGRIVQKYQRPVFNLCFYMLKNAADAEDAAQEIFLRAYTKLATYNDQRQFSTWLFTIASHYCIDNWRKHRLQLVDWNDCQNQSWDQGYNRPDRVVLQKESAYETRTMLASVSAEHRLILVLKYWHEMSYEEMAQTLDTSVSAIKSRLFRARKVLAQKMLSQQGACGYAAQQMALVGSY